MGLLEKLFGNYSEKEIKKVMPIVKKIDSFENEISKLSDEELKGKTESFKERYNGGESLDNMLPEAFAVVREAGKRCLNMRHFEVQLIGGVILHQGRIAEMKTGEGKTLVATLPAYLNALTGEGVHIVTVNDYLAKRDAGWIGEIFKFLGLTVGVILNNMSPEQRKAAYGCDITYATNNELGFDYLRDNMVTSVNQMVQRNLAYAIIDEVDSVLIDEARTPLIISGSGSKSTQLYQHADVFVKSIKEGSILNKEAALNPLMKEELQEEGDFVVDEKAKSVTLTQDGVKKAEKYFKVENLTDPTHMELLHYINNALKANYQMHGDKDYVVQENEVVIVDEFTGRLMPGRRYSDGLHQAIEAKEKVQVKRESKTLATVTFQNFFNKYGKKCGMTGTALTEEEEFRNIYNMDVIAIPTNLPVQRKDHTDVVYQSIDAKNRAVVKSIKESHEKGQPVLVGTITIERSEHLSSLLKKEKIPHKVLNAKYHEKEAEIVALAGQKGAVTIATNMAGRGTDIKLGEGVKEIGGLKIIGTERHESRRIDNQLRGRAGRQGDPGESKFYISLEDDLMRLFGAERTMTLISKLGFGEDEPIEHDMLGRAIENAQKKVEGNNFSIRKHLLEYDKVMNEQREIIYNQRNRVLNGEDLHDSILSMIKLICDKAIDLCIGDEQYSENWDFLAFNDFLNPIIPFGRVKAAEGEETKLDRAKFEEGVHNRALAILDFKAKEVGGLDRLKEVERLLMLKVIDQKWMDHIDNMVQMRQGIGLHAYAQRDPLTEYKYAGYDMFDELTYNIQSETIRALYHLKIVVKDPNQQAQQQMQKLSPQQMQQLQQLHKMKQMQAAQQQAAAQQAAQQTEAVERTENTESAENTESK